MAQEKPRIALIDPDDSHRQQWLEKNPDIELTSYASPECFLTAIDVDPDLLTSFDCIITDGYFDEEEEPNPRNHNMAQVIDHHVAPKRLVVF